MGFKTSGMIEFCIYSYLCGVPMAHFTMQYDQKKRPILDMLVKKINVKIETAIFYKTTNTKRYLRFNWCHLRHTKTNISFNPERKIRTIVSGKNTREFRLRELKNTLINR